MKTIVKILVIICGINIANCGTFRPEDTYRSAFWISLTAESRNTFIRGVSCATGMQYHVNQREPLVINSQNIPSIIELLNKFYARSENKEVFLRLAIEVCLMQFYKKADQQIASAITEAKSLSLSSD